MNFAFIEGELHPAKLFTVGQENEANALSDSSLEEAYGWFIIHVGWTVKEKHCEKAIAVLKYRCVYLACLSSAIIGEQVPQKIVAAVWNQKKETNSSSLHLPKS